jgi:uncharacterized protein (DUF1015 family)
MARLYPFRALRYDPTRVNMTDVVTQPYDKISPAMQEHYYEASPYNLIRVILGKHEPNDSEANNVYTRAAHTLNEWRAEGILKPESEPALYGYSQTYEVPGSADAGQPETRERRGFIALGQLYDYADHIVYRHEQTFPKHKSDRLALFKATRAYCEQIYMLYSDPTFTAEHIIFEAGEADAKSGETRTPDLQITDEYGVVHRLWKLTDPALIHRVLDAMADKELIIADGHHRYETSVAYMHERAADLGLDDNTTAPPSNPAQDSVILSAASPSEAKSMDLHDPSPRHTPQTPAAAHLPHPAFPEAAIAVPAQASPQRLPQPNFPEAAMMMTFVNMDAPGITILPTHRVAFGLIGFHGRKFAEHAEQFFTVAEIPSTPDGHFPGAANLLKRLNATPGVAFIAATREGDFLLTPKPDAIAPLLAGLSPRQAALDVTQLHKVVLEELLGLNEETVRAGSHVRYLREATDALEQVGCGNADVAFLIKPVTLDQMRDISLNLEVMPQKSTDFYPKLLSGLAMYTLD